MHHRIVTSSFISMIGHDPKTKKMHVTLTNGDVHEFDNVEHEDHEALIGAKSIGAHFNMVVKEKHDGRKL